MSLLYILTESSRRISSEPTYIFDGASPERSAKRGETCGSVQSAEYISACSRRRAVVSEGSLSAFDVCDAPERVRSVHGEIATMHPG